MDGIEPEKQLKVALQRGDYKYKHDPMKEGALYKTGKGGS
jgi:hypothetical protein